MVNYIYTILIISLCAFIYGKINNKQKIKEVGCAGLVFSIIVAISDYIYYLDF